MKPTRLIYFIIILFFLQNAKCDIVSYPDTAHYLSKCVQIINLYEFRGISLIGVEKPVVGLIHCFLINDNCIRRSYKGPILNIYAVRTNYLLGRYLNNIEWDNNNNVLKSNLILEVEGYLTSNSNPLIELHQNYSIKGFTDSTFILYKSFEKMEYDTGEFSVSIFNYKYEGDTTALLKKIPTPECKNISKSIKIVNLNEYYGVSLIARGTDFTENQRLFLITDSSRIGDNYMLNTLDLYATRNRYINSTSIYSIEPENDKNVLKADIEIKPYTDDYPESIKISAINEYYKIIGFTDKNVVLWKFKEVFKAEDGSKDSVLLYDYEGDTSQLVQMITTPLNATDIPELSYVEIFPNPANSSMNIRLLNKYSGEVILSIYSLDGKKIKSNVISINYYNENIIFQVDDLTSGVYFLKIEMTGIMVTEKIIID